MHRKRVTSKLHDSYFRSMMIKTCYSKDGGSCIFRWPFMGRDWVGFELLYNSVHRKFNQSWRYDAVEKTAPCRRGPRGYRLSSLRSDEFEIRCGRENQYLAEWAPRPPVEQSRRTGKKRERGKSICCSSVWSPTPSHTQPFQIKWEVYFFKELCCSSLLCRRYDSACTCTCRCIMCSYSLSGWWLCNIIY